MNVSIQWPDFGLGIFYSPPDQRFLAKGAIICMIGPIVIEWPIATRKDS